MGPAENEFEHALYFVAYLRAGGSVVSSGPRRRTLAELVEVCGDEELFAPLSDGRVVLVGRRGELEQALGVNRGSLWRRLQTLVKAGLAEDDGRLVVDMAAVRQRLEARVVSLPTERTRQYQRLLEDQFDTAVAADGTATYHHPDGRTATLADVAAVTGARSRGTAHHHLRRLQAVPQPPSTPPPADAVDHAAAVEQAIAGLAHLAETWTTAGLHDHATTVFLAIDTISRCAATATAVDNMDAALAARTATRPSAALREPKRGANAARAREKPFEHEYENESTHSHDATPREPRRDTNAAPSGSERCDDDLRSYAESAVPGSAAADRTSLADLELPDWDRRDAPEIVQPLIDAFGDRHGRHVTIDTEWFVEDMMAWPRAWIDRAVDIMASQIESGRAISNPGGLFAKAVQGGWLEYFPPTPPFKAADLEQPECDVATRAVAEAEQALARMGAGIALDVTFEQLARPVRHGDLDDVEGALPALLASEPFAAALREATANGADPAAPLRNALAQQGQGQHLAELLPSTPTATKTSGQEATRAARIRLAEASAGSEKGHNDERRGAP